MTAREDACQLGATLSDRGRPRRMLFFCMKAALVTVVVAVVAAGVLLARIAAAPISIDGLGRTIARSLQDRFGNDLKFSIGSTSIVQRGFGTTLAVDQLAVTWADGQDVLTAPRGELAISTLALMFGKIVPKRLDVFDVTLRAVFLKNGNMALAAGDGSRPFFELGHDDSRSPQNDAKAGTAAPPNAMRQAARMMRQVADVLTNPNGPIAAVDRLGISHGTLVIRDQETNAETVYRDLGLEFGRNGNARTLSVSAAGPNGRWSIDASASGRPMAERHFGLDVRNLTIDELKLAAGSRSKGLDMDAPVGLHLDVGLAPNNQLIGAKGGVVLGQGFLKTDDPDFEPLFIDAISSEFHWSADTRQLIVDDLTYREGNTSFAGAGEVRTPVRDADPWQIALHLAKPGVFAPDRKGQQPIAITEGAFEGELFLDRKLFKIDRMTMRPEQGGFALAGSVEWEHGPHVRLGISMDPTPVQVIERVWPSPMASAVRAWVLNHFEAGIISSGVLKIDYDSLDLQRMRADVAPADQSVSIDFKVSGGRIRYLDGVPPLENIEGTAHISGRSTSIDVASATTVADGKTITLRDGTFLVPNSSIHPVEAHVRAHLDGPVEAVTAILTRDALKPYASLPLDPATLHGDISGELTKGLLLGSGPADPDKETLGVSARITNFQADSLIGKEALTDATMNLDVSTGAFQAVGQGKLFGGAANFNINRKGSAAPHAEIDLVMDEAARAKSGMSSIPGVSGPVTAHVATDLGGDPSQMKANITLDLSKAAIAEAYLGVNKPAGRAGRVLLSLTSSKDHMSIDPLQIDVGSLQAKGSVELAGDNSFRSAHFGSFKVSSGDDMRLDVSRLDDIFKLTVRGGAVDARPFLKAVTSIPTNEATPMSRSAKAEKSEADAFKGFDIDLKTSLLTGFNKEVLSGAELRLSKRGSAIRQFAVQGRFGRNALSGSMSPNGIIKMTAQDAGALVSFIDLYKHMEGGALSASFRMGDDTLRGNLEIRDFILRNEPAIERLVATSTTMAPPGEGSEAVRRIDGGAVGFNRLKVNFERDGSHLQLSDATMHGPEIGLSVDGWLDYSHDSVGMKGTFVPAYAVNNLFSQVPVFGMFLGGKSNEGLLAITFNISGQASQPSLTINPLSVIAPGILRNIFGIFDAPAPRFSGQNDAATPH